MRRDIERRINALEEKVKPPMVRSWVDLMLDEDEKLELSPEFRAQLEDSLDCSKYIQPTVFTSFFQTLSSSQIFL